MYLMPKNVETDRKSDQNDRKDGEDRDESDQNLKRGNVTKHLKVEACLGEHWYVSLKSCKSRMLLEEEEELCPGEEDHESSQVTRRVAVEQTERRRKSMRGDLPNLVGTNRRNAVKRRTATSLAFPNVMYLNL